MHVLRETGIHGVYKGVGVYISLIIDAELVVLCNLR